MTRPDHHFYRTIRKIRVTYDGPERAYLNASGNPAPIITLLHTFDYPIRMASVRLTRNAEFFVTNTTGREVAEAIRILTSPRMPVAHGGMLR